LKIHRIFKPQNPKILMYNMKKKTIFLGQRVSDEDWNTLVADTKKVCNTLDKMNYITYSTLDENEEQFKNSSDWLFHAFKKIDKSDIFLAIVKSEKWSEGLLMEVGYVLAKKKIFVLAINRKVKNTYLREMTDIIVEFNDTDDLIKKFKKLKI